MGTAQKRPRRWNPKAVPERVAYRRREVVRLRGEGYTTTQIAGALDILQQAVSADLTAMGIPRKRVFKRLPDPAPVDWLTPPAAELAGPVGSPDRLALAVRRFLTEMDAERYKTAHAHDLLDARRRGDRAWLDGWAALTARLRAVADTLAAQHQDGTGIRPPGLAAVPSANGTKRTIREEVERRTAAGLPVSREALAREYGASPAIVQKEHERAQVIRDLLAAGWSPPANSRD